MAQLNSFVPMTGRGAFDVTFMEGSGFMTITVKVFPEYEDRPVEQVSWTKLDQINFEAAARAAIEGNWNGKYRDVLPCHMLPALEAIQRITNEEGWTVG